MLLGFIGGNMLRGQYSFAEFKEATNGGMQMHNLQSSEPVQNPLDNSVQKII